MMFALGNGPCALPVLRRQGPVIVPPTPAPSAPISSVSADGWQAAMIAPADLALAPVTVSRQGFTPAGAPTTHSETLHTTRRVRQPYPNQSTLTADKVALSDFVYATDTIAGVTNSSALASPRPVMQWADVDRQLVGNSIELEVTAFHRNGMALVRFFVSDGTTTVTADATSAVVFPKAGDQNPVIVYRAVVDLSTLANPATLTVNAWGYPRVGTAASIRKSDDRTTSAADRRLFSPRTYLRDTAKLAAPVYVAVSSSGSDGSGVASTTVAIAEASPFATFAAAMNAAIAAGGRDNMRVRLMNTVTWTGNAPAAHTDNLAEAIIEPGTGVARSAAVLSAGGATAAPRLAFIRFRGITINKTGAGASSFCRAVSGCHGVLDNVAFQNNGQTIALSNVAGTGYYILGGCSFTGVDGSLLKGGNAEIRLLRGATASHASGGSIGVETWNVLGCNLVNAYTDNSSARSQSGAVVAFNRITGCTSSVALLFDTGTSGMIDGLAVVQNVLEEIGTNGANRLLSISGDGAAANTSHAIVWYNTGPGFDAIGRWNLFYDETGGTTRRTHTLMSVVGNLAVQINTKHDVFVGTSGGAPAEAPNRTGGWSFLHGVGCIGSFTMFRDAGSGSFAQDYPGLAARIGTSNTAAQSPAFAAAAHTTSGPGAGAGGGTYTLGGGSPAKGMVAARVLPFDLAGAARPATSDAAGAYV